MKAIRALDRGLEVLLRLSTDGSHSLHELHLATGTPKASLLRILGTLEARGVVWRRIADGRYSAGHHLVRRARYVAQTERLVQAASPVLDRLCETTLWPSDLAIPRRDCMEICETNRPHAPIHVNRELIGLKVPMLQTAHGRAYLSFCDEARREAVLSRLRRSKRFGNEAALNRAWVDRVIEETRAQGYGTRDPRYGARAASSRPGQGDGLLAIAVPVHAGGTIVGTVNILWVARVATEDQIARRHLEDLRGAARLIGENFDQSQAIAKTAR
jgi:IclR family mhp operon transcriptional activator